MAVLQIDPILPELTPAQSLTGLRREFCVELLGDGIARVFVRAVETSSFKAAQLQRAVLFRHLDARFTDLAGCVESVRVDLERLADSAKRTRPAKENLNPTGSLRICNLGCPGTEMGRRRGHANSISMP